MNATQPATVIKEVIINAPVDKVWKALTDKDQIKQWYFDLDEFKPEVGFEFRFIGQDHDCKEYMHICVVKEVVVNKKLRHSWRYEGYEGDSTVTWELFDEDGKTRVKLTHEGLETYPPLKAFAKENFNEGWTHIVGTSLRQYLESSK